MSPADLGARRRLRNESGRQIVIDGLWGLRQRRLGRADQPLYFAAGPNNETNGLLGSFIAN